MPIHIRAQPGDYAESCLLPGDPNRARLIAERFLEDAVECNSERGLYGYTGTADGKPVSVQATGMGGAAIAIVVEELVELGVKRFLRVGTCGALQSNLAHGDLILALAAVPDDGTSVRYTSGEPHVPTADWDLLHGVVHAAKGLGERPHVGPIVSTDVFYDPDEDQVARWSARGLLAVEMEAAALFTVAALRGVQAGCVLAVSDVLLGGRSRIGDDDLSAAVDRMVRIALAGI
ncbi:MAG: purine-nucleoside phosphorylase [Actinobacteria bacterium]|nr:purine-nucleoside phosphorylase [Actinomycetota bacterium]